MIIWWKEPVLVICSLRKEAWIMILTFKANVPEQDFFISHILLQVTYLQIFDHMAQAELPKWASTCSVQIVAPRQF